MFEREDFIMEIETMVHLKKMDYIDAVVTYCEVNSIEIEVAANMLNSKIKEKIAIEASDLNLLKEKINHLPV